ncbi:NUDIX hydrolase, partial [bacterium]
ALGRELDEEAGVTAFEFVRVAGVYSDPTRDLRFHAVTVVVECIVDAPTKPPMNPLEILEVRAFTEAELPRELALGQTDMFARARAAAAAAATGPGDVFFE